MTVDNVRVVYLRDIARTYRNYKTLGERAIAQVTDDDLHKVLDPEANSIAIIARHLAGNLSSRFTDFLTSDGEKPNRNRDAEFEMPEPASRAQILQSWEAGWAAALTAIDALTRDRRVDSERCAHSEAASFRPVRPNYLDFHAFSSAADY